MKKIQCLKIRKKLNSFWAVNDFLPQKIWNHFILKNTKSCPLNFYIYYFV